MKKSLLITVAMLGMTGCGTAKDVDSNGTAPHEVTPTPTPLPGSQMPNGIYVAPWTGKDDAAGTWDAPLASLNLAIETAHAQAKSQVFLYGGGLDSSVLEVVVIQNGVGLTGSVCRPQQDQPIEFRQDRVACGTVLAGGSPAVLANGINTQTALRDLAIEGSPAFQTGLSKSNFMVEGIGCVGHGVLPATSRAPQTCAGPVDGYGRPLPQPALGLAVRNSSRLALENVTVEAKDAGDGLPFLGTVDKGANGGSAKPGVAASGNRNAGSPGLYGVNNSCDFYTTLGGVGGVGGYYKTDGTVVDATSGYSEPGITNGTRGLYAVTNSFGAAGTEAPNGTAGALGEAGMPGTATLEVTTLVGAMGANGKVGKPGRGGGGGGGGAAAVQHKIRKQSSGGGFSIIGTIGGSFGDSSETTTVTGATAGGGGGSGGAGGCGGAGGIGGQGGAASVAIYIADSQLRVFGSTLKSGEGGKGAAGSMGGDGGLGGTGAGGTIGAATAGSTGASGNWNVAVGAPAGGILKSPQTFGLTAGSADTTYKGQSQGGYGGKGGNGGNGGNGGIGGGGAGGFSILVLRKGNAAADIDATSTVELGLGGIGGGAGVTKGADGKVEVEYDIY